MALIAGPFLGEGDILGHEPMGEVIEVGPEITNLTVGDRVVVPFNISCGHCWMCEHGLQTQCETPESRPGMGASLFGYTKLYGQVAGGQAEFLRIPQAHYGPIKEPCSRGAPRGCSDCRSLCASYGCRQATRCRCLRGTMTGSLYAPIASGTILILPLSPRGSPG